MLDIIFISYDEPNADTNWANLKAKYPHAKRVHGVEGVAAAHFQAAKRSTTSFFYVVDADAEIDPSFDFEYKPAPHDADYTHIWYSLNPVTGDSYGYGGIKLFNKKSFREMKSVLDFSTTLTKDIKIFDTVSCVTRFNSDPYRAFRGAFREAAKLYATINDESKTEEIRQEAEERFDKWMHPIQDADYVSYVNAGVELGVAEAKTRLAAGMDLSFINDHALITSMLKAFDKGADLTTDPTLEEGHPMKTEFSLITRISSVLYDQFVFDHLDKAELRDALSDGQLYSKIWLIDELRPALENYTKENPAKVVILGGWIGLLAHMMFILDLPVKVTSVDLDARANIIAEKVNWDHDFKASTQDMYGVDYSSFDVIINTSSEHIPDISKWRQEIPAGKIIAVQNNNYEEGEGHISTVPNSSRLRTILQLSDVTYDGARTFPQYNRFMLIGTS